MGKIKVVISGKVSKDFAKEALKEYQKLITPFAKLEIVALKEKTALKGEKRLKKEEEEILKHVAEDSFLIVLDENGVQLKTERFSEELSKIFFSGREAVFVIGSDAGVSPELKKRADLILSLSTFTLAHQVALVVLLEQIYRALTIIKGHPYHRF